jgi:hypothetical protein
MAGRRAGALDRTQATRKGAGRTRRMDFEAGRRHTTGCRADALGGSLPVGRPPTTDVRAAGGRLAGCRSG